jgi:hypothetical protein
MSIIKSWFNDPATIQLWEETWKQPHMKLGLEVLNELAKPIDIQGVQGQDLLVAQALENKKLVGYNIALQNIKALGTVPKVDKIEPEPYSYVEEK